VRGLINFAGGLRSDDDSCPWQAGLEAAFANYGAHSTLPSLWFYGRNDSYFKPALAARLRDDYVQAGGRAELVAYGPFKRDAHGMAGSQDGFAVWWPETRQYLESLGMPTGVTVAIADDPEIPASRFASLDDVDAIPYLRDGGRRAYRAFLGKETPRAFAVSPNGAWSWAEEGEDPAWRARSLPGKRRRAMHAVRGGRPRRLERRVAAAGEPGRRRPGERAECAGPGGGVGQRGERQAAGAFRADDAAAGRVSVQAARRQARSALLAGIAISAIFSSPCSRASASTLSASRKPMCGARAFSAASKSALPALV
jgi:hypothetical protein